MEIWPENWPVFQLFARLSTQWRVGMGGATGLDYGAAFQLLDRLAPRDSEEWDVLLDDLRAMETEALSVMHED